jgi:hypothetical protein
MVISFFMLFYFQSYDIYDQKALIKALNSVLIIKWQLEYYL